MMRGRRAEAMALNHALGSIVGFQDTSNAAHHATTKGYIQVFGDGISAHTVFTLETGTQCSSQTPTAHGKAEPTRTPTD